MNITEPIRRQARITPDATAIVQVGGRTLSYLALDQAIDRAAEFARGLGLRQGDIAARAIAPPQQLLGLVMSLALARIGVVAAPFSLPAHHVKCRLTAGDTAPAGGIAYRSFLLSGAPAADPPAMSPGGDAPCVILSTSGTTGRVKHIANSHDLMTRRVICFGLALGGGRTNRLLFIGQESALGLISVLRTLWQGGTLILPETHDIGETIRQHRVQTIVASPANLAAIIEARPATATPDPHIESIEVSGSTLPPALYRLAVERLCPNIVDAMGSSEANGFASAPVHRLPPHPGATVYLWPGVEVQALDDAGTPLPPGKPGRLRIRSDLLAPGYFDDPEATAAAFRDGWFHSDDIGTVWPDGALSLGARASHIINAGGVKIDPTLIESTLLAMPDVTDAAAFGVPDHTGLEQVWIAFVATRATADVVLDDACKPILHGVAPEAFIQMKSLPRNANGKIDRAALVALAHQVRAQQGEG